MGGWLGAAAALGACGRRSPAPDAGRSEARAAAPEMGRAPGEAAGPGEDERPAVPDAEPIVRVRVRRVSGNAAPLRIGTEGRWLEFRALPGRPGDGDEGEGDGEPPVMLHAPIEVGIGAGGWSALDGRGFRPPVDGVAVLAIAAAEAGGAVTLDEIHYPGSLRLVPRSDRDGAGYDLVNHVPLERYLPGVLEKELYRHWHRHTFAAQAIAARSFACGERSYRARRPYDLTSTARSQVYVGGAAHEVAVAAVERTRGLFLAYRGRLVPGYYSSCCGGVAATASDAISAHPSNDIVPLRGRAGADVCTDAELYSWTITRPLAEVTARLSAWARRRGVNALEHVPALRDIAVADRNPHGRPRAFRVRAGESSAVLDAESLRRGLDQSGGGLPSPRPRLWSSFLRVTIAPPAVRFDGAGHGHGAGMCQHGAEALARSGASWPAILGWYYPQVEIVQGYGVA